MRARITFACAGARLSKRCCCGVKILAAVPPHRKSAGSPVSRPVVAQEKMASMIESPNRLITSERVEEYDGTTAVVRSAELPAEEARKLANCRVLPPARQGDVWRALSLRPRVIALVDGVFEAQPSVWHHELLAALEAGVALFGGARDRKSVV